ncbi:hypothetical protein Cph01nite_05630 [Cellulomonas phragmiteti]|uniref:Gram-positive cocci surface proteins LPxTG domain-containing protein n=2 Tax=Cellulomonas phragmiteti TaxID=478780 RepID=A0ABQ4DHH1_9CELL|nr:hypothetical protein Cph01nite_05630 [Cellulomonas phragmiteti]
MKISRLVATATIAGALALAPTAAFAYGAADYTNVGSVSTASPVIGQSITITVVGPINAPVNLTITSNSATVSDAAISIAGTRTLQKITDATGTAVFTVTLAQAGTFTAIVTDATSGEVLSTQTLSVVAAPGTSPSAVGSGSGQLSATGSNALPIALGAGALLLVGAGGVVYANKRRQGANV